jgi:hypothetical protein
MPLAALPHGIFGPDAVDVAYEPWQADAAAALRVGPDPLAPVVLAGRGVDVVVQAGGHVGRQSTRNPGCLERPALRPAVAGFVWGYGMPPAHRKSGWVALEALRADPGHTALACGPAGADFDRREPGACGGHCDGRPLQGVEAAGGPATVIARDAYLRYSPGGTAFRYLVRGDRVRRLCRWRSGRKDYTAVNVRAARWAPRGARGWVISSALR